MAVLAVPIAGAWRLGIKKYQFFDIRSGSVAGMSRKIGSHIGSQDREPSRVTMGREIDRRSPGDRPPVNTVNRQQWGIGRGINR